jgi:hypothetical protein
MSWASRPPHQAGESATTPQGDPGDIDSVSEREVVTKFAEATESGGVDGVVSLPTMPPEPLECQGPAAITRFLSKVPGGGASRDVQARTDARQRSTRLRLLPRNAQAPIAHPHGLMIPTRKAESPRIPRGHQQCPRQESNLRHQV